MVSDRVGVPPLLWLFCEEGFDRVRWRELDFALGYSLEASL